MRLFPVLLALSAVSLTHCTPRKKSSSDLHFYGTDSQKATLSFETQVEFSALEEDAADVKTAKANKAIESQLKFLFGSLKEHPGRADDGVLNSTVSQGIPSTFHSVSIAEIAAADGDPKPSQRFVARYSFKDEVAFSKDFLKNGEQAIRIRLPRNPAAIYGFGLASKANALKLPWTRKADEHVIQGLAENASINLCTDFHYNSPGDFWYFWNPYRVNCPSIVMDETLVVAAKLSPIPSTSLTFPEYNKMLASDEINITYIVGPNEDKTKLDDVGRQAFEKAFTLLTEGKAGLEIPGFKIEAGTRAYLNELKPEFDIKFKVLSQDPFSRTLVANHQGKTFFLFMYLIHPLKETPQFQGKVRNALKRSDILIYDGHSGLGYNLELSRLFNFDEEMVAKDKYQIYFFNACSTFAYYNQKYFARKAGPNDLKGTKNLEIVTTSIGADYSVAASTDFVFLHSLVNGSRPSWQKIMDAIYAIEPKASALTQVNGDEDNAATPQ